nr:immunoglobulin heavy chain junction region [Macaca mulatta]MOV52414.1 immunoglobulin heavy chain junction region [Macaca mulatta]
CASAEGIFRVVIGDYW